MDIYLIFGLQSEPETYQKLEIQNLVCLFGRSSLIFRPQTEPETYQKLDIQNLVCLFGRRSLNFSPERSFKHSKTSFVRFAKFRTYYIYIVALKVNKRAKRYYDFGSRAQKKAPVFDSNAVFC